MMDRGYVGGGSSCGGGRDIRPAAARRRRRLRPPPPSHTDPSAPPPPPPLSSGLPPRPSADCSVPTSTAPDKVSSQSPPPRQCPPGSGRAETFRLVSQSSGIAASSSTARGGGGRRFPLSVLPRLLLPPPEANRSGSSRRPRRHRQMLMGAGKTRLQQLLGNSSDSICSARLWREGQPSASATARQTKGKDGEVDLTMTEGAPTARRLKCTGLASGDGEYFGLLQEFRILEVGANGRTLHPVDAQRRPYEIAKRRRTASAAAAALMRGAAWPPPPSFLPPCAGGQELGNGQLADSDKKLTKFETHVDDDVDRDDDDQSDEVLHMAPGTLVLGFGVVRIDATESQAAAAGDMHGPATTELPFSSSSSSSDSLSNASLRNVGSRQSVSRLMAPMWKSGAGRETSSSASQSSFTWSISDDDGDKADVLTADGVSSTDIVSAPDSDHDQRHVARGDRDHRHHCEGDFRHRSLPHERRRRRETVSAANHFAATTSFARDDRRTSGGASTVYSSAQLSLSSLLSLSSAQSSASFLVKTPHEPHSKNCCRSCTVAAPKWSHSNPNARRRHHHHHHHHQRHDVDDDDDDDYDLDHDDDDHRKRSDQEPQTADQSATTTAATAIAGGACDCHESSAAPPQRGGICDHHHHHRPNHNFDDPRRHDDLCNFGYKQPSCSSSLSRGALPIRVATDVDDLETFRCASLESEDSKALQGRENGHQASNDCQARRRRLSASNSSKGVQQKLRKILERKDNDDDDNDFHHQVVNHHHHHELRPSRKEDGKQDSEEEKETPPCPRRRRRRSRGRHAVSMDGGSWSSSFPSSSSSWLSTCFDVSVDSKALPPDYEPPPMPQASAARRSGREWSDDGDDYDDGWAAAAAAAAADGSADDCRHRTQTKSREDDGDDERHSSTRQPDLGGDRQQRRLGNSEDDDDDDYDNGVSAGRRRGGCVNRGDRRNGKSRTEVSEHSGKFPQLHVVESSKHGRTDFANQASDRPAVAQHDDEAGGGGQGRLSAKRSDNDEDGDDDEDTDAERIAASAQIYLQAWRAAKTQHESFLHPRAVFEGVHSGAELLHEFEVLTELMLKFDLDEELAEEYRQELLACHKRMKTEAETLADAENLLLRQCDDEKQLSKALDKARSIHLAGHPIFCIIEYKISQIATEDKIALALSSVHKQDLDDATTLNAMLVHLDREHRRSFISLELLHQLANVALSSEKPDSQIEFPDGLRTVVQRQLKAKSPPPGLRLADRDGDVDSDDDDGYEENYIGVPAAAAAAERGREMTTAAASNGGYDPFAPQQSLLMRIGNSYEDGQEDSEEELVVCVGYLTPDGYFTEKAEFKKSKAQVKKKKSKESKKPKATIPDDPVVQRWLSQQSMTILSSPALELARQKSQTADVATKKPPAAAPPVAKKSKSKTRKTAPLTPEQEERMKYQGGNQRDLEKIEVWKKREADGEVALCALCPPANVHKKKKGGVGRVFENEVVIRSLTMTNSDLNNNGSF